MVISIPESKKINMNYKRLNESFVDDEDEIETNLDDMIYSKIFKIQKPKVEEFLNNFGIKNYEIKLVDQDIIVDVNDNLYLPNVNLSKIYNGKLFKFGYVEGICNFSNNGLTDWSLFPKTIKGNLYANFNKIKDFEGVPQVYGHVYAEKQKTNTKYVLSDANYVEYKIGTLLENKVHILSTDQYGELVSINESLDNALVKLLDGSTKQFRLNDIDCLAPLEKLFKF